MKVFYKLFPLIVLASVIGCSKDESQESVDPDVNSCGLPVMSCEVPFPDTSNYPTVPSSGIIIVGGTAIDSIQNAIQKIDANNRSLFFPSGTYQIPVLRNTLGTLTNRTILSFVDMDNLEIYGEQGTVFQLDFSQETVSDLINEIRKKQIALLTFSSSENIYVHDITLKGNFEFTGQASDTTNFHTEHRNILVRDSRSVYLYDLTSENSEGDAVTITASTDPKGTPRPFDDMPMFTSDIYITNIRMNNLNRNGVSIAGGGVTNNVFISKSTFGGKIRTQQIDFEPTANSLNTPNISGVDIWDNTFQTLALSSNRASQGAISILTREGSGVECVVIRDNDIKNDIQILRGASSLTLERNKNIPSLVIANNANKIQISENDFNLRLPSDMAAARQGAGILIIDNDSDGAGPSLIIFSDNTIEQQVSSEARNIMKAFSIQNADLITADSNKIDFSSSNMGSTGNIGFSISFEPDRGLETMTFVNAKNDFFGIDSENEIQLSGQTENIFVSPDCQ